MTAYLLPATVFCFLKVWELLYYHLASYLLIPVWGLLPPPPQNEATLSRLQQTLPLARKEVGTFEGLKYMWDGFFQLTEAQRHSSTEALRETKVECEDSVTESKCAQEPLGGVKKCLINIYFLAHHPSPSALSQKQWDTSCLFLSTSSAININLKCHMCRLSGKCNPLEWESRGYLNCCTTVIHSNISVANSREPYPMFWAKCLSFRKVACVTYCLFNGCQWINLRIKRRLTATFHQCVDQHLKGAFFSTAGWYKGSLCLYCGVTTYYSFLLFWNSNWTKIDFYLNFSLASLHST